MKRGRLVLLVLAGVTIASLLRTTVVERDKHRISAAYHEAQQTVAELDAERAKLSRDLSTAQEAVHSRTEEVTSLQGELKQVQTKLDETTFQLATLQREHEQLRAENTSLSSQVTTIESEKQQLEARLNDLKELRLAIHQVKQKMSQERWAAWRARVEAFRKADQERLAAGNRGFVLHDGSPTLGSAAGSKLRVQVLEPQAQ